MKIVCAARRRAVLVIAAALCGWLAPGAIGQTPPEMPPEMPPPPTDPDADAPAEPPLPPADCACAVVALAARNAAIMTKPIRFDMPLSTVEIPSRLMHAGKDLFRAHAAASSTPPRHRQ